MDKYYDRHQEDHIYMFVKRLNNIPYSIEGKETYADLPDDGKIYFEVISNHFLKGMIFKMDSKDFHERFTTERYNHDVNKNGALKDTIYNSREWLFYEKVMWWNSNIKEILNCKDYVDMEHYNIYNNYMETYKVKFKCDMEMFIKDTIFFDDLLSEVYVNEHGKVKSRKKSKTKRRCDVCGNYVNYYEKLPNGKVMCKACLEMTDNLEYIKFEKQWEG